MPKDLKLLWYLDENGEPAMTPIRIGMTDGTSTEIVESRGLEEGTLVITGTNKATESKSNSSRSPMGGGRPPGRPF